MEQLDAKIQCDDWKNAHGDIQIWRENDHVIASWSVQCNHRGNLRGIVMGRWKTDDNVDINMELLDCLKERFKPGFAGMTTGKSVRLGFGKPIDGFCGPITMVDCTFQSYKQQTRLRAQ